MNYPKTLEDLIESFKSLPSIGRKSAERLALHVYSEMSREQIEEFSKNLENTKEKLHECKICHNLTEEEICPICSDADRNQRVILIVETIRDLFAIENTGEYNGVYHVLGGSINFKHGRGIEDLNIKSLLERVNKKEIDEIILGTNATLEGETTARYLKTILEDREIKVTRLAHGLPVGGDLTYADEMTVLKALDGRSEY